MSHSKERNSHELKDFRPISLLSSIYKVLAMVLAYKTKLVFPRLLPQTKVHSLKVIILDPILIASKLVEYKLKKKWSWIIKLELEKAFDMVNWDFLSMVLQQNNFGQLWIRWIRGCIKEPRFSIFVNGRSRGWVRDSRGLRQDDPFSSFLFLRVSDVLGSLMENIYARGSFEGFVVGRNAVHISHLQLTDDTILFCKDDDSMLKTLCETIAAFEVVIPT